MRKFLLRLCISIAFLNAIYASAQCGAGYTQAQLNWDKLDYYYNSSSSAPYGSYVNNAMEQTQKFAIGPNYVTIVTSAAGIVKGENGTHTGDVATNYSGDDAQFTPSAGGQTITLTFNTEVKNLQFTLYDVDASQRIDFSAADASSAAQNINVVTYAGSILTIGNNNATNARITASSSTSGNTSNIGTATITVSGPVKTFILSINTVGSNAAFWLSDINACVSGSFPTNYHQVGGTTNGVANAQPFTGPTQNQSDYFLVTPDNQWTYYVDPVTGKAYGLFTDVAKPYVNSYGYDQVHHILYYVTDGSSSNPQNNQSLKKYDCTTGTISTVIPDLNVAPFNIPTMDQGVESAGASFYNGSLYLGIEGGKFDNSNSRETIVYEIDFDASLNPTGAVQVFATPAYSGGTSMHDWGDFFIKDGVLYDFNTARGGSSGSYTYTNSSIVHYDMMTGTSSTYMNPAGAGLTNIGQVGLTWSGNMYSFWYNTNNSTGGVEKYNMNGTFGAHTNITPVSGMGWPGGAGDASEPFRPKCDFGDAPVSYDPNPVSPAVHERFDNIRLGASRDSEWVKNGLTGTEDGSTDDGLAYVPIFNPLYGNYLTQVSVYNNSGAPATVCAWLDYNGNGVFDAGEGVTGKLVSTLSTTIPSSASLQQVWLYWPSTPSTLPMGSYTYLRIRVTSQSAGMTTAMPTGFFFNGEVEDYKVSVNTYPLAVQNSDFNAQLTKAKTADLTWSSADETDVNYYTIEKSANNIDWNLFASASPKIGSGISRYELIDGNILDNVTYYRLKTFQKDGKIAISSVRQVNNKVNKFSFLISPNPVVSGATVSIISPRDENGVLEIFNSVGIRIYRANIHINAGSSSRQLPVLNLSSGIYIVSITSGTQSLRQSLIVNK